MKTIEIHELIDGTFKICEFSEQSVFPTTEKKTAYETVARVAQILGVKESVNPQDWPERICIGEIELRDNEDNVHKSSG